MLINPMRRSLMRAGVGMPTVQRFPLQCSRPSQLYNTLESSTCRRNVFSPALTKQSTSSLTLNNMRGSPARARAFSTAAPGSQSSSSLVSPSEVAAFAKKASGWLGFLVGLYFLYTNSWSPSK